MSNYVLLAAIGINALWVLYQDIKYREVYLLSLISFTFLVGWRNWNTHVFWKTFLVESVINLLLVLILLASSFIYLVLIKKRKPSELIGIGDLFLFLAFAVGYGISKFYIHVFLALLASLLIHLLVKRNYVKHQTVPLAGYMAAYFLIENLLDLINLPIYA